MYAFFRNKIITYFQNYFIKSENLYQYNTRAQQTKLCLTDPTEY